MKHKHKLGFTLVELIVTVLVLSILATLAFVSLNGYIRNARNSARLNDLKLIEKSLSLYMQVKSTYPLPDSATSISYSGAVLWNQGFFGTWVVGKVKRISPLPKDPLTKNEYTYSISNNGKKYQLAGVMEWKLFSLYTPLTPEAYALDSGNMRTFILWDFSGYDTKINVGTGCVIVTTPSMVMSNFPPLWVLNIGELYSFAYHESPHIPAGYSGSVGTSPESEGFPVLEVHNSCRIENMNEFELYIAKLSTAYQSLATYHTFSNLIYNSESFDFKKEMSLHLKSNGIILWPTVVQFFDDNSPENIWSDNFSDTDGTYLPSHASDNGTGWWDYIPNNTYNEYTIFWNKLIKNINSSSILIPDPAPEIFSANYSLSYKIEDFWGGNIYSYLRYIDAQNFYRLKISANGYEIIRRVAGVDSVFQNILEAISLGSTIKFSVYGDSLVLNIDGFEKENILGWWISLPGTPGIILENNNASIDSFTLQYK